MFKAPSDEDNFNSWKKAIPKRDIEFNTNAHDYSKHFKEDEIICFWTSGEGDFQIKVLHILIYKYLYTTYLINIIKDNLNYKTPKIKF